MTELKDFSEISDGGLVFPYKGKKYIAPEISIPMGIRLNDITNHGKETDLEFLDLIKDILGPVYDDMVADGVPLVFLTRVGSAIITDFQFGRIYAEAFWETGADPAALAKHLAAKGNREARRAARSKTAKPADTQVAS